MTWLTRIVLCALSIQLHAQTSSLDFSATDAGDSASLRSLHGIRTLANPASKVRSSSVSGTLNLFVDSMASEGQEGYSAFARLRVPLAKDWSERNMSRLDSIHFRYRLHGTLTDAMVVRVLSQSIPKNLDSSLFNYAWTLTSDKIANDTLWHEVAVPATLLSPPIWWTPPANFPNIDSTLKRMTGLEFEAATLYKDPGSQAGKPCTRCVAPTMGPVLLEIDNIRFGLSPIPEVLMATDLDLSRPAPNAALAASVYGIQAIANPWSSASARVVNGAATLDIISLASDSTEGYSSYAALKIPLRQTGTPVDMSRLRAVVFEWRNLTLLPDGFDILLGSTTYPAAYGKQGMETWWQWRHPSKLVADSAWKRDTLRVEELATPIWWIAPDNFPEVSRTLASMVHLQFAPSMTYSDDGTQNGKACRKCVNPIIAPGAFQVRSIRFLRTPEPVVGMSPISEATAFRATWVGGTLRLSGFEGVSSLDILSTNGRRISSVAPSASIPLPLPHGVWMLRANHPDRSRTLKLTVP